MFNLLYLYHTSLFSPDEKEVNDNIIRLVGSEMDIRRRQNVLLIIDKIYNIYNKVSTNLTKVSSGSLAECLGLPGSDMDVMRVPSDGVNVIQDVQHMNRSARCATLLVEYDMAFPGFSKLKLIAEGDHEYIYTSPECFVETINGIFCQTFRSSANLLN